MIRIRIAAAWLGLLCQLAVAQQAKAPPGGYEVQVATDRPEALYKAGETVKFTIRLLKEKKPVETGELTWSIDKDGYGPKIAEGKAVLSDGRAEVSASLKEPGFLLCRATYRLDEKQSVSALAGAGVDPLLIKPSLPVPDDFDAFWTEQKAKLAAVPMNPKLTPVKSSDASVECFDLQCDCAGGAPVSGYYARPAGAKPKSLPAVLWVHGAGVYSSNLAGATNEAKSGMLALDINAHGIPNGKPAKFYADLSAGELKGYPAKGRETRETCYFTGMCLRLIRALDFLCAQPEWDGRILMVRGGSQGGLQSIAAAGLDARVTFIAAGVPAGCDHSGAEAGRVSGWPKIVPLKDGKPDPKVLQAARYVDCMNFATRAKADAILSVGFIDTVCPPTSVYAAYNALAGAKRIVNEPLMGHSGTPRIGEEFYKAVTAHIKAMRSKAAGGS